MKTKAPSLLWAIILLVAGFYHPSLGQTQVNGPIKECGAQPGRPSREIQDQLRNHILAKYANNARAQMGALTTVPVVWFLLEDLAGAPSTIPSARVLEQMDILNAEFEEWGIRFCIATNTPKGKPLLPKPGAPVTQNDPANPGIFWVDWPFNNPNNFWWYGFGNTPHQNMVNAITDLKDDDYLFMFASNLDPLVYGYGNPGQPNATVGDGVVVDYEAFGGPNTCPQCTCFHNNGLVLVHEVGHYLGLDHLNVGGSCAGDGTTATCYQQGDLICDIGYQPFADPNFSCISLPLPPLPCSTHTYVAGNHMDYMADQFKTSFSRGQADFMDAWLHIQRSTMIAPHHVALVGCRGTLRYVNAAAVGSLNDGTTWGNAFLRLEDALQAANWGDEIWVQQGTYSLPTTSLPNGSFDIPDGVSVYGGFAGWESQRNQRTLNPALTVLSGLNLAYHVVTSSGGRFTTLDGFQIREGNATGPQFPDNLGAGILLNNSNIAIANCNIQENAGMDGGTGAYCLGGMPVFVNDIFVDNSTVNGSPALSLDNQSDAIIVDCKFSSNFANAGFGGGLWLANASRAKIANSIICFNQGIIDGGGIYCEDCIIDIVNCTIYGNQATALVANGPSVDMEVVNTIIMEHVADLLKINNPLVSITYSSLQFATTFPDPSNKVGDPKIGGDCDLNLPLMGGSHCIDAGRNSAIIPFLVNDYIWNAGRPRVFNGNTCQALNIFNPAATPNVIVDMGADEFRKSCPRLAGPLQADETQNMVEFLTVFPNPTLGGINVSIADNLHGTIDVFDLQGKHLLGPIKATPPSTTLSLNGLSKGSYFLVAKTTQVTATKIIVLE